MSSDEASLIRVIIADDHHVTRTGLRITLNALPDFEVIGEAGDGAEALRLVDELKPDVLLLDVEMPRLTGVEVARRLQQRHSPVRVLALSAYDDERYVYGLLDSGAAGYLMKEEADADQIIEALRGVAHDDGDLWISERLAKKLILRKVMHQSEADVPLTPQQEKVLKLIALGYDNGRIAELLTISKHTVKNHIDRIKHEKIGVRTRAELIAWAWQHGVVKPGEAVG